jgi:hypothetical protein
MKQGEMIRMVVQETGEERFYQVSRVYGSDVILRVITQEEAGDNPRSVLVGRIRQAL